MAPSCWSLGRKPLLTISAEDIPRSASANYVPSECATCIVNQSGWHARVAEHATVKLPANQQAARSIKCSTFGRSDEMLLLVIIHPVEEQGPQDGHANDLAERLNLSLTGIASSSALARSTCTILCKALPCAAGTCSPPKCGPVDKATDPTYLPRKDCPNKLPGLLTNQSDGHEIHRDHPGK